MHKLRIITACVFAMTVNLSLVASATETTGEKIGNTATSVKDSVKGTAEDISDKGCEMVNGKMECAGKKAVHKMKQAGRKIKNKAVEVKDKVD